ncbi:TetR/AcrR family transcriptional regulator [Providencia alcalifaciens]
MPKIVDHELRRKEIVESFLCLASTEGLENISLRNIASHARVSLRQVQYYFENKENLILAGLSHLEFSSHQSFNEKLQLKGTEANYKDKLKALFEAALPIDENSKMFHQLWTSYAMMAQRENSPISKEELNRSPIQVQALLEQILVDAKNSGELISVNIECERNILLGLVNGLSAAVLSNILSKEESIQSFIYHIERL